MPRDATQPSVPPHSLTRKHGAENAAVGWIAAAAALVPLMMAACLFVVWALLAGWTRGGPWIRASGFAEPSWFPGSRSRWRASLKPNLCRLILTMTWPCWRDREAAELESYGWIDRKSGIVRIPHRPRHDRLAQRGLPTRATNQPAAVGQSEYDNSQKKGGRYHEKESSSCRHFC